MSYTNPKEFGIIEDVGAFNRSFQKRFGEVMNMIALDKAENKKLQEKVDETFAEGIEAVNKTAKGVKDVYRGNFIDFGEKIIEDVNFGLLSQTDQAYAINNVEQAGADINSFSLLQENLADYKNVIPAKYLQLAQETYTSGGKNFYSAGKNLDAELRIKNDTLDMNFGEFMQMFDPALLKEQGNKDVSKNIIEDGADFVNKQLSKIKKENPTRAITQEDISNVFSMWEEQSKEDINSDNLDYFWNNQLADNEKGGFENFDFYFKKMKLKGLKQEDINGAIEERKKIIKNHFKRKISFLADIPPFEPETFEDTAGIKTIKFKKGELSKNINALGKKLQDKVLPLFSNFDDPNIANLVTYIEGLTGIESVDISKIIKKGDKEAFKVKGSAKDVTIDTGMSQAQIKVALLKAAGATDEEIENFNLTKTESEFSVGGSEFSKPNKNPLLND